MARTEQRFGAMTAASILASTYYLVTDATVPASTTWNLNVNLANRATTLIKVRVYIATTSWSSGEPAGSTLVAAIMYDHTLGSGEVYQVSGVVMKTTEKLVVWCDTGTALDIIASGVALT